MTVIPRVRADLAGDRLAERQDALRIDIVSHVEVDAPLHFVGDVLRQAEIRLADVALDDPVPGLLDRPDIRPDLERVLGADPIGAIGEEACAADLRTRSWVRSSRPGWLPAPKPKPFSGEGCRDNDNGIRDRTGSPPQACPHRAGSANI